MPSTCRSARGRQRTRTRQVVGRADSGVASVNAMRPLVRGGFDDFRDCRGRSFVRRGWWSPRVGSPQRGRGWGETQGLRTLSDQFVHCKYERSLVAVLWMRCAKELPRSVRYTLAFLPSKPTAVWQAGRCQNFCAGHCPFVCTLVDCLDARFCWNWCKAALVGVSQ